VGDQPGRTVSIAWPDRRRRPSSKYFYGFIGGEGASVVSVVVRRDHADRKSRRRRKRVITLMSDMTDKAIAWNRPAEGAHPGPSRSSSTSRPERHMPPPSRSRRNGQTSTRGSSTRGWDQVSARKPLRDRRKAGRHFRPIASSHRPPRNKSRRGTRCRRRSSRCSDARWRSMQGFLEYADHHVGRLLDSLKDLQIVDDTLGLLHHRRTTAHRPRARSTAPTTR